MSKQLREKRRIMIERLKIIREERTALHGIPNTTARWDELTGDLVEAQRTLDYLNRLLSGSSR